MALPKVNPTKTKAWRKLEEHFEQIKDVLMLDLFKGNRERAKQFSISWKDFYLDYSKNRITDKTRDLLIELAEEVGLKKAIEAQFEGDIINETEERAVGHTQLRKFQNLPKEVQQSLAQMKSFSEDIISGNNLGYTGKPITHVVNIGIGGSHLGPSMVVDALKFYRNHLKVSYISNVDGDHAMEVLNKVPRETTLFIIVSKTFTTQETITNAHLARRWFLKEASVTEIEKHFVAVSTNLKAVKEFGIAPQNIFPLWDWVGGRFSLWSAVGLSSCLAVGYEHFENLLKGAEDMDLHFRKAPFNENLPVMMAMLSIWYNNFFKAETEAVLPYSQYLHSFVDHLQQAIMESNGKRVDRNGEVVNYTTGTIVWGSTGTNAQHAFYQLIHQGTKMIPADFICFKQSLHGIEDQQQMLLANCLAQTEALLTGTIEDTIDSPYREFEGNKPTNTLLIERLTPASLGSLIALYEHKLFVQGIVWNIFSFDQWGVELGKKVADATLEHLTSSQSKKEIHESTIHLIKKLKNE
ncbi:MAG: glucose-6-phosphate isomerase [Flavobacteriaceae bacterium]|nr:glucose-6-phosphate isomerase [Flavobacteriaceae bacterium]